MTETSAEFVERAVGGLLGYLDSDDRYAMLSSPERAATLAWVLVGLVRSDGFEGWVESIGDRGEETVEGLRDMGAEPYAQVVGAVLELFPSSGRRDADARLSAMTGWQADGPQVRELRVLEQRFMALTRSDGLIENYVAPYIREHPEEIPTEVDDL